jgi:hypothetical protein
MPQNRNDPISVGFPKAAKAGIVIEQLWLLQAVLKKDFSNVATNSPLDQHLRIGYHKMSFNSN